MQERPQVNDADVAFANAQQIASDDGIVIELIEFHFRDCLHAGGALDDLFGETLVAFLHLILFVGFDRSEIDAGLFERVGRVLQVIGEAQHLVALSKEDHR